MYLSPVSSATSLAAMTRAQKSAAAPAAPSSSEVNDTVTLSSAAQKGAGSAGDVDHDGDSH